MNYIDGFVIPIAKNKVNAYAKIAKAAGKVWMDHGALEYWECKASQLEIRDPLSKKMMKPFVRTYKLKKNETLFFSYILYQSKKHRDSVNKKVMKDKRITGMTDPMPFDMNRMCFGGFVPVVKMKR